jgi:hypothetical protein
LVAACARDEPEERVIARSCGSKLVPLARAGVDFVDGVQVERTEKEKGAA